MKYVLCAFVALLALPCAAQVAVNPQEPYTAASPRVLPDPVLTPGMPRLGITANDLCPVFHADPGSNSGTGSYRNVPSSIAGAVYRAYGMTGDHHGYCAGPGGCEVDHLCSIELGCSNDAKNLWPQPYFGLWNAHVKDKLENKLHAMVCAGTISLGDAQDAIRTNWIEAYKKYIGPTPKVGGALLRRPFR